MPFGLMPFGTAWGCGAITDTSITAGDAAPLGTSEKLGILIDAAGVAMVDTGSRGPKTRKRS